jgi:hypothetical protein
MVVSLRDPLSDVVCDHTHTGGEGMVTSVTAVRTRLTTAWAAPSPPEAIIAACEGAGDTSWRDRVRTPVTTIQLFL